MFKTVLGTWGTKRLWNCSPIAISSVGFIVNLRGSRDSDHFLAQLSHANFKYLLEYSTALKEMYAEKVLQLLLQL